MKAPVLALVVAAVAFGGTSIYFWNQMQTERNRAQEYAARSAALTARIAELEKARTQFQQRRFASANNFGDSPMGAGADRAPPADPGSKAAPDGAVMINNAMPVAISADAATMVAAPPTRK